MRLLGSLDCVLERTPVKLQCLTRGCDLAIDNIEGKIQVSLCITLFLALLTYSSLLVSHILCVRILCDK